MKDWKEQLKQLNTERSGSDNTVNLREQKKRSRIMYKKRKLDKDIKNYIKNTTVIKYKTIDGIAKGHGFYFG